MQFQRHQNLPSSTHPLPLAVWETSRRADWFVSIDRFISLQELTRKLAETFDPSCLTEVFLPEGTHRVPMLKPTEVASCRAFVGRFAVAGAGPGAVRAAI